MWLYLILLAIVQGITEFLPISSSGHLALMPAVAGVADQGPLIDLMAHAGTLLAVLVYFRRDVGLALQGKLDIARGRFRSPGARLVWLIGLTLPPVLLLGAVLYVTDWIDTLRAPLVIAVTSIVFGFALWWADARFPRSRTSEDLTLRDAIILGLAQAIALIPGTSRSGITMTAGRALHMTRPEAARFSMLMAIPVIAILALPAVLDLTRGEGGAFGITQGMVVAGIAFITALLAIGTLMALLKRMSFLPFVVYRVGLGLAILIAIAIGWLPAWSATV